MTLFFEIANISYKINVKESNVFISSDVAEYFTETMTEGNLCIEVELRLVDSADELETITGNPVHMDSYHIVLNNVDRESRIFLLNSNSNPYATYREIDNSKICIECVKDIMPYNILNMRLLELLCFEKALLGEKAFILHACYIEYKGRAIVFTAPSGTGKSTQGALWERNRQAEIINGDRCIIQKKKDGYYVCGTPFCGSSTINKNRTLPLAAIVIVNQDSNNYVKKATHTYAVKKIFSEATVNRWNVSSVMCMFEMLEQLYQEVEIVDLFCTPTAEAVEVLERYIMK